MNAVVIPISAPQRLEDLGVRRSILEELALKIIYLAGEISMVDLADLMRLSTVAAEQLFIRLRKEHLVEVTGMLAGVQHRFVTTSGGKTRAQELLRLSQYAGPAPVSLADYSARVQAQTIREMDITPEDVHRAFSDLVLEKHVLKQLGTAAVSGRTVFLYGPTGTGKTSVAESFARLFESNRILVPHAIEVDGQIITVFDPVLHKPIPEVDKHTTDRRWVCCERPKMTVGGELTLEMLDLQYHDTLKYYTAPVQMKANNGLLVIDDFGRQRMQPSQLLNRWVVPLERRVDYLTLAGGSKIDIPFDVFVILATNINPAELMDDAFLRRIQTKIKLDCVSREQFAEIFRRVCESADMQPDASVIEGAASEITQKYQQPLRPCHPRDIVQQICWEAKYEGRQARLDIEAVQQACKNYFVG
ncbi:MAG TPA: hypothetical protein VN622_06680 [Clostridia bacterium]|nr:hypothetical protein [Clostridia bacterium]